MLPELSGGPLGGDVSMQWKAEEIDTAASRAFGHCIDSYESYDCLLIHITDWF